MMHLDETIQSVEQGLRTGPAFLTEAPETPSSLNERMIHYNVPGMSIAVINNGVIEWAKGYGLTDAAHRKPVTTETLFAAASISKPVTALAILRLVEQGLLDLETDINQYLKQWKVLENELTQSSQVTLRHILSHMSGLDAGNYSGYGPDEPAPTLIQLLNGEAPSNSGPVQVITEPGTREAYSGPGYWVLQQLIIDLTGESFADAMRRLVLEPSGMTQSTFDKPRQIASGHDDKGSVLFNDWARHPGLADGGLWTTPTDLACFALAIINAANGIKNDLLSQPLAQMMLARQGGCHGLGLFLIGKEENLLFRHGGEGAGFLCQMDAFPALGQGAVIMTNGVNGWSLKQEVLHSLAVTYDWPQLQPIGKTRVSVDPTKLAPFAGMYKVTADPLLLDRYIEYSGQWQIREGREPLYTVQVVNDYLSVRDPGEYDLTFYPESNDIFFTLDDRTTLLFHTGADGMVDTLDIILDDELSVPAQRTSE
ncbi:MAG: serine hydrolase domain-containing protein [Chloroflexota bacterium]